MRSETLCLMTSRTLAATLVAAENDEFSDTPDLRSLHQLRPNGGERVVLDRHLQRSKKSNAEPSIRSVPAANKNQLRRRIHGRELRNNPPGDMVARSSINSSEFASYSKATGGWWRHGDSRRHHSLHDPLPNARQPTRKRRGATLRKYDICDTGNLFQTSS